jgi:hypothetical protein
MHAAYQLQGFDDLIIDELVEIGRIQEEENSIKILESLESFVKPNGAVDVGTMIKEWFPIDMSNVFISHSRADKELALTVSGILSENFGLRPFVDSCVWGLADKLLWEIDTTWCPIKGTSSFSYELRNITTAHIHMMLSTALTKMMDRCECVFFLNTENSVSSKSIEQMISGVGDSTHSPWLFHEISMMKLLRRRSKEEHRDESIEFSEGHKRASAELPWFDYPVDLDGLPVLTVDNVIKWRKQGARRTAALDLLYQMRPPSRPN